MNKADEWFYFASLRSSQVTNIRNSLSRNKYDLMTWCQSSWGNKITLSSSSSYALLEEVAQRRCEFTDLLFWWGRRFLSWADFPTTSEQSGGEKKMLSFLSHSDFFHTCILIVLTPTLSLFTSWASWWWSLSWNPRPRRRVLVPLSTALCPVFCMALWLPLKLGHESNIHPDIWDFM